MFMLNEVVSTVLLTVCFFIVFRQIEEKREYLANKGYDQEVIDFEIHKVRQPHPLLSGAVGSPAFLSVSPPFTGQPSSPVPLFHLGDQSFDTESALAKSPLRMETMRTAKGNRLEDLKDLLKYVDFTSQTTSSQSKSDAKKSLNELRQDQDPRWENNFDSVGSSGVGSSMGTEYLDMTRDTSASNSRKSSIDLTGSQNSLSELMHSYQQQQHYQVSALGQVHVPAATQQGHQSIYSQPTANQHHVPHHTYPFYTSQFPYSMTPFGGFQTFPVASQQAVYQQAGLNAVYNQYVGNTGAFTMPPGYQSQQALQESLHQAVSKTTAAVSGIPSSVTSSTVNHYVVPGTGQLLATASSSQPVTSATIVRGDPAPTHTVSQQPGQSNYD